jgi:hypothetical protein
LTPSEVVRNPSPLQICAALAGGLFAIYFIPFHVPVHDGLSISYLLGFSNRAAFLVFLIFAFSFALWTRGLGLRLPNPSEEPGHSFRRTGQVAIACSILGGILVWLCTIPIGPVGEAQYFFNRSEMFRMGAHLYRDFSFDYGPLMFYPPIWIARFCNLSVANSYYVAWILQWGLGTWTLWKTVQAATRGSKHGRVLFLLLWMFFLPALMDSGSNYTPLRFSATLATALGIHHLFTRGAPNIVTFGLAAIGATAFLFYSPEQGIAFTLGTILFFAICVRPPRKDKLVGLASFALVMFPVFWIALRMGVFGNVLTAGGGGLNFPLLISFQTLVLLLLLIVAGCAAIASFHDRTSQHPLLYLICISLVCLPAAFSHADIGHIFVNTLGAMIAALTVLSQYRRIWRWTWPSFAVVILLATLSHVAFYRRPIEIRLEERAFSNQYHSAMAEKFYTIYLKKIKGESRAQRRIEELRAILFIDPGAPHLPFQAHLLAPLGVPGMMSPYVGDPQIVTGRYPWLFPLGNTTAVQEKIAELQARPDWPLILPSDRPLSCDDDPDYLRHFLKMILYAPYVPRARNQLKAAEPFCKFINTHYILSTYAAPVPSYHIWVRKGNASAAAAIKSAP